MTPEQLAAIKARADAAIYEHPWCDRTPGHSGDHVGRTLYAPDGHTAVHLRAAYGYFPTVELIHDGGGSIVIDTPNARGLARVMDGMGHPDVAETLRQTLALMGVGGAR